MFIDQTTLTICIILLIGLVVITGWQAKLLLERDSQLEARDALISLLRARLLLATVFRPLQAKPGPPVSELRACHAGHAAKASDILGYVADETGVRAYCTKHSTDFDRALFDLTVQGVQAEQS